MFADPIASVTYATVAQTLPRISTNGSKSVYRKSDGSLVITLSHQTARNRVRSMARLDRNIDTDANSVLDSNCAVYLVIDRPVTGFSETDVVNQSECLFGALTASTNAGLKKLYAQES